MIFYIIYFFFFAKFLTNICKILHTKLENKRNLIFKNQYFLLFPVLEEQKIVSEKIKYLDSLLQIGIDCKIIFIVSPNEKERLFSKKIKIPTTEELLHQELFKFSNLKKQSIIIGEQNNSHETKATKINYAIKYIRENYIIENYIIGFFDFDSKLPIDNYIKVDNIISHNKDINVFSTIPVPIFENSNFIGYSAGFFQLERVFFKEFLGKIEYCMGAGIFIRGKYFTNNLLPIKNDDISFGYKLFFNYISKKVIKIFNPVTLPKKSFTNIKQLIPVYSAVFSYFSIMIQEKKISIKNILYGFYVIGTDIFDVLEVILFFVIVFIQPFFIIFILCFWILKSIALACIYKKYIKLKSHLLYYLLPFYYIFGKFFKFFAFVYFIIWILSHKNIYGIKTER